MKAVLFWREDLVAVFLWWFEDTFLQSYAYPLSMRLTAPIVLSSRIPLNLQDRRVSILVLEVPVATRCPSDG
jgi:hypothetical protein